MKILFVDDNPYDFELARRTLTKFKSSDFVYIDSVKKFYEHFQSGVFDIIISDYNLPDGNGTDVFNYAKTIQREIPFIILSGALGEERAVEIMKEGVTDYVLKNNLGKLPVAIHRALEESKTLNEKLKAEEELKKSEEQYRCVVEDQTDIILRFNAEGNIDFINQYGIKYLHLNERENEELNFFQLMPARAQPTFAEKIQLLCMDTPILKTTHTIRENNGEVRWEEWTDRAFFDENGNKTGYQSIGRDVTTERKAEIALSKSHRELQELNRYLHRVKEEERTKIAREIHDEMGQQMAALKMQLSALEHHIGQNPEIKEELHDIFMLVDDAVKSVRRISSELRPPMLSELGLFATIEWKLEQFSAYSNIKCHYFNEDEDVEIDQEIATNVYRILQESLTNISRYAKATVVNVSITNQKAGWYSMLISDNGIGFDTETQNYKQSCGLIGMKERAKIFNGSVDINSSPGKGTTVITIFPAELMSEQNENYSDEVFHS